MKKGGGKYCPKCGASAKSNDSYCIKCGYSFKERLKKKSSNLKSILIAIIILAVLWTALRIYLKKPIIPQEIIDFLKGLAGKSG